MYKKLLITLSIIISLNSLAGEVDDIKYISRLYGSEEYQLSANEAEKFLYKYPNSKQYNTIRNILGQSFYRIGNFTRAEEIFESLINKAEFSEDAIFYLAMINIENSDYNKAYKYAKQIKKNLLKEKIIFSIGLGEYSSKNIEKSKNYFSEVRSMRGAYKGLASFYLGIMSFESNDYATTIAYLKEHLEAKDNDLDRTSESYYKMAISLERLGYKNEAYNFYLKIEKEFPSSKYYSNSLKSIFYILLLNKNNEGVIEYAEKLRNSEFEELIFVETGKYFYENNIDDTAEKYLKITVDKYSNLDGIYYLARLYMKSSKYDDSIALLERIKEDENYRDEYYLYTGYIYFEQGKYKEVVSLLNGIENKLTVNLQPYYQLISRSAHNIKDYETSTKYYKLIATETNKIVNFYEYFKVASMNSSIEELEKLFLYYKENYKGTKDYAKDMYDIMGTAYANLNRNVEAEKIYLDALQITNDPLLVENLSIIQVRLKKFNEAYKNINSLEKTDSRELVKGTILINLKKYSEAETIFKTISKTSKDKDLKEKGYLKLSELYLLQNKYNEIINLNKDYESEKYKSKEMNDYIAIAYLRLGQFEKSREKYNENINLSPDEKGNNLLMIAESYYNEEKFAEAKKYYKQVYDTEKNKELKKKAFYSLILVANAMNDSNELIKLSNSFRKEYPNSDYQEEISYMLASNYEINGMSEKALIEYETLYNMTTDKDTKEETVKRIMEMLYNKKDYSNALNWAKKISEDSYKNYWIGQILYNTNKDESIKYFEKLSSDKEYGELVNYKIGTYYFDKKEFKKSRIFFEKVLLNKNSEDFINAKYNIALTYEEEADYKKAINTYLEIKNSKNSIDDILLLRIAENYEYLKDLNNSFKYLKEYFDKYKNKNDYLYVTEKILVNRINIGNKKEAKIYYDVLFKLDSNLAKNYESYIK